ncbi:ATP-binding protein [Halalkalibacter kiskunsagensis]|uniref:histidine kinase n=1 Tax=Halalkalibacter kiskunsagensis TaxID=1548599 RepID=A0ABV6KE23_9BACI
MKQESYILESKYNCKYHYKMDPNDIPFPKSSLVKTIHYSRKQKYKELLTVSRHFMKKLLQFMEGIPTLVMFTDHEGYILEMYGDETIQKSITSLGIDEGVLFEEQGVGTNSISLALKYNKPIQIIGKEHYHYCLHSTACMSAPFSFDDSEKISGTISIMTTIEYASSFHLGLLSSAVDSIERELKIRKQNRRLNILHQVMIDSTKSGIIITDTKGTIIEFNPAGEYITGHNKENIIGHHVNLFEPISIYIYQVLQQGSKFENLEITFHVKDQWIKRTCLFDALPIYDENEKIMGAFGQFRDITERIMLEEQVIAAEKLSVAGKLGAGFAHEIRNPLTSIIGFAKLLKTDKGSSNSEKHLSIILDELERIKHLVNQFVIMAKPSSQMKKECSVVKLIREMIYLMNTQSSQHHVKVEFISNQEKDQKILIDESQIKQVIINLIQNAIEAMPSGGNINVNLSEVDMIHTKFVKIEVEDNGEGLTEKEVVSIFTPFYSSKEEGLGLGLSICKQIVESHKGIIDVTSVKGKGTTFKVLLPV